MSRKRKKSKQRSNRLKRIGKRLAAYSAAAAATVVASQDRAANAAPVMKAAGAPQVCHRKPKRRLAGKAARPTTPW